MVSCGCSAVACVALPNASEYTRDMERAAVPVPNSTTKNIMMVGCWCVGVVNFTTKILPKVLFTCKNIQGANDGLISTGLRVRQDVESAPMPLNLSSHPAPTHGQPRLFWSAEPTGAKGVNIPGGNSHP